MAPSIVVDCDPISVTEKAELWDHHHDETCSLCLDDLLQTDEYLWKSRRLVCRNDAHTDEPMQWADVLFEPTDIVEFRLRPSKELKRQQLPQKFHAYRTHKELDFYPWLWAEEIECVVSVLGKFNAGVRTHWKIPGDKEASVLDDIPLNIYCSLNPRLYPGGSSEPDVVLARNLCVDLENTTVTEALDACKAANLPYPTMIVVSGHGVHLYWRLLEPIHRPAIWTAFQKRLISVFAKADTAIHDASRVMRVPGFWNVNGTPASCKIVEAKPTRRYVLAEFDVVLPALPKPQPAKPKSPLPQPRPVIEPSEVMRRATAYMQSFETTMGTRSEPGSRVFGLICNLVEKFGVDEEQALYLATEYNCRVDLPLHEAEVEETTRKAFNRVRSNGRQRGTLLDQVVPVEKYQPRTGQQREIEEWRAEMVSARLKSLNSPGHVFFDGSTTGAGKSTADIEAMRLVTGSVTLLPTHHACDELAEKLNEHELVAAAHPPLDGNTCLLWGSDRNPGEAQRATKAGLNVPLAICPECPHFRTCEYQRRREDARQAPHIISTHARASLSGFEPGQDKPLVFVHEDPLDLLRPTVRISGHGNNPTLANISHLRQVILVAEEAIQVAKSWSDDGKVEVMEDVKSAAEELVQVLHRQDHPKRAGVEPLSRMEPQVRPDRLDYLLFRAMKSIGVFPHRDAVRVAVSHALGELAEVCVVTDDVFAQGGKREHQRSLVGVWQVDPPQDSVVWFESAHGDSNLLASLVGRKVEDATPSGWLDYQVAPLQYANQDVTQSTCENTVRGLVRGVLARYPQAKKVGIITHQSHVSALNALEPTWSDRICRVEYFRSGKDRASNSWVGNCDVLVVLGTPRVPPAAVREKLVQIGRAEDAGQDGMWGKLLWEGKTPEGELQIIESMGYKQTNWKDMHQLLVKETVLQAVGRGRGVLRQGVPVLVVSNESLGLPVSGEDLPIMKDAEASTLQVVQEMAKSANFSGVITTSELADRRGMTSRQILTHLTSLESLGLVGRGNKKGSWVINQPLPTQEVQDRK